MSESRSSEALMKLVLCILGFNIAYYYLQNALWESFRNSGDLYVYYSAARTIWTGQIDQLYNYEYYTVVAGAIGPYLYLPFFAIIFSPFTYFSFKFIIYSWLILNQIILAVAVFLLWREFDHRDVWIALALILMCFFYGPIIANTHYGNINELIWILVLLGWWLYKNDRPILAGFVIALGIMIKLSPGVLAVYFLYRRAYKVVFSICATSAAIIFLTLIPLNGFKPYFDWYSSIFSFLKIGAGKGFSPTNQSVEAFYGRLESQGFLSESFVEILIPITLVAIVLITYGFCRFKPLGKDDPTFELEYSLVICLMVLIPNLVMVGHYTVLMTSYFLIIHHLYRQKKTHPFYFIGMGLSYTLVSFGAFGGTSFSHGVLILMQSPKLYGTLMLWGLIIYQLYTIKSSGMLEKAGGYQRGINL